MSGMKSNKKIHNPFKSGSFNNLINHLKRKDKKKDSPPVSKSTEALVKKETSRKTVAVVEVTDETPIMEDKLEVTSVSSKENRNRAKTSIIKALHLNSIANQLQKQRHREENKDKAKRNSSLVIPGEEKLTRSEKSVEDLLEIRNDYKESVPQQTIKRKINREHEVAKRRLENIFVVEEKQPIMQLKPSLIQEIDRTSLKDEEDEGHPIQKTNTEAARANIQPILSKLYEKKLPSEWLSKLDQSQSDHAYEHILHCLLYPLISTKHRRESLAYFYQHEFRSLRKAFNISEEKQLVLFERSSMLSHYVISMLETRLSELKSNPIYQTNTFEDPNAYVAWKQEQQTNITSLLDRLQNERNFDGDLTVIVLEARDLAAKDQGSSDPYCKLHITRKEKSINLQNLLKTSIAGNDKKQRKKTSVVKESLEPVWCEEFTFKLNEDFNKMELKLEVWDLDSISDHFMGEIRFPLSKLSDQVRKDLWIDLQKSKESQVVSGAIHLVLHFTYRRKASEKEPPVALPLASIAELHNYYRELIYKLIQLENPDLKEKEIQPLSQPSLILLEEFALRYGIHGNYHNLVHLELLVEYFRYQLRRSFVEEIVQVYYNIEASKSNLVPMSIKETELYNNIIKDFEKQLVNILKRYKDVFKSRQMDGTLQLLIKMYTSIKENQGEQVLPYLKNYIVAANHLFYDTFAISQEDENIEIDEKEKFIMVVDGCMTSIEEDVQLYEQQFPMEIVRLSALTLRDRISEGASEIVKKEEHVTKTTFDVYFKLNEFNEFLKEKETSISPIPVADLFKDIFIEWIKQTQFKLSEWSSRMLKNENWQPIDEDEDSTFIHSGSVVDIFHSISEAVKFLLTIPDHQRANIELFIQEVLVKVVSNYIDEVQLDCINKLRTTGSSVEMELDKKKKKPVMIKLGITKDICVRINNIETCQNLLLDFSAYLSRKLNDEEIEPLFDSCFRHVRSSLNKMIEIITEKMNSDISEALKYVVNKSEGNSPINQEESRLDPLFSYLNGQLDLLSEFLYGNVFQKVLKQAFVLLIKDLEAIVVPFDLKDKYHRYETVKLIEASLKEISSFFNADGEGIPSTFIDKQCAFLTRVFELFKKDTSYLVQLHQQLESEYDKPENEVEGLTSLHILSILACRKRQNRDAKDFLKRRKKSLTDIHLRKNFNLDQKEEVLEKFKCVGEGEIHVTTHFFCFEPSKGDERAKLAIVKMKSVTKTSMTSIQIVMQDLETFKFSAIMNVSSLLEKLQERATSLKNVSLLNSIQNTEVSHVVVVHAPPEEQEIKEEKKKEKKEKTKKVTPLPSPNVRQVSVLTNEVSDAKLQKFRKKFKQSENATILAGFHCSLKYAGLPKAGKMKISEEYLCFNSMVTAKLILAFNTITDLQMEDGKIKVQVQLEEEKKKKFTFSNFDDVTAVYKFLKDMWETNLKNKL